MHSLFHPHQTEIAPNVAAIPAEFPQIDGAGMAAASYGERAAGDFYDSLRVSPERVLFGLLDVAGRRQQNQEILTAAQNTFRTLGTNLFASPDVNEAEAMVELCLQLNRTIMHTAEGVRSCPAFIACYHEKLGTLCYCNAGHTPGLLSDRAGVAELAATGLPLGLFSHATSDAVIVGLEPAASLLPVSRGVVEAVPKDEKSEDSEFALTRVKENLQRNGSSDALALCESILKGVAEFMGAPPSHNDMTALALVRSA